MENFISSQKPVKDEQDASASGVGTFIDLRHNFGFRRVFGTPGNEDLLLALIDAILPEKGITSVKYMPTENMGIRDTARSAVFDVTCTTSNGDYISVEMQFKEQDDFNDRLVFYSSFPIFNSVIRGGDSYAFKTPVYIIGILNFIMPNIAPNDRLLNHYRLKNTQDLSIELTRDLTYITLELPKFTKSFEELKTLSDKLIYCIAHIHEMNERPASFNEKVLVKLFEMCKFANMTEEQQHAYIRQIMAEIDVKSQRRWELEKATAEGLAEGKAQQNAAIARSMLADEVKPEVIAKYTGLSIEEIAALK